MKSTIQTLLNLQGEDLEVLSLRKSLNRLRSQIELCHKESERLNQELRRIDESVLFQESQKKLQELDLAKQQEQMTGLNKTLKEARNNKEYTALSSQIKLHEHDIRKVEEAILEIMEVVEGHQGQKDEIHKQIELNTQKEKELEASIVDDVKNIESGISDHQKSREEHASQLDELLRTEYERLFERFEGEAVCVFEDGTCAGCYMTLSSSFASKLSVGKELVRCPSCGRLLFAKDKVK